MQYIGERGGIGGNSVLSYVDYFAAPPGNGWKALNLVNEFDIFKLRRSGAIPAQPRVLAARGGSANLGPYLPDLAFAIDLARREMFAIGPEAFYYPQNLTVNTAQVRLYASPINGYMNTSAAKIGPVLRSFNTTLTASSIIGLAYANGEIHALTGVEVCSQKGGEPWPAKVIADGVNNGPVTVYPATGLTANHTQLCYGAGAYVAWSMIAGVPTPGTVPRYSTDNRATFPLCTLPGLNTDGAAAGGTISWMIYDPLLAKFVGVSVYGEILTSTDGITWTKAYTRTSGGTTYGLVDFCMTKDGKLLATGTGAGNGQYYEAPSIAGPWSLVTVAIAGKTFGSRARGIGYTAGVRILSFDADTSTTNQVCTAYSLDEGLNHLVFSQGGDGSIDSGAATTTGRVLAVAGVAVVAKRHSTESDHWTCDRLTTDFAQLVALPIHNDAYSTPRAGGAKLDSYMKVS